MHTSHSLLLAQLLLLSGCVGLDVSSKLDTAVSELDSDATDSDSRHPDDTRDTDPDNGSPVAKTGDDLSTRVGTAITLDGSASHDPDGDTLTFSWEIESAPAGSSVTLLNADRVDPQFVPDEVGVYNITLVVDDGHRSSTPDELLITASPTGGAPVANAGPDRSVDVGDTVSLDGSASQDPDGDNLSFVWLILARPAGSSAVLSFYDTPNPAFVADISGEYQVQLIVDDGGYSSDPDIVRITASEDSGSTCGCARAAEVYAHQRIASAWFFLPLMAFWRNRRRIET